MEKYTSFKLSDKTLLSSISMINTKASSILSDSIEVYYTDHSIHHSERIIKLIDSLLIINSRENYLTELERYILIASIYLHDIGMQNEKDEKIPKERRDIHQNLSSIIIKRNWKEIGIIEDLVDIVALITEGHRGNFNDRFEDITIRTCERIRCELLSSLLYLGDELDISHERVNPQKFDLLNYPPKSALHIYKHYYTQGIDIGNDHCIIITFRYPSRRKDQYHSVFGPLVLNKIERVVEELTPILHQKHEIFVIFNPQKINIEENDIIEEIEPQLFDKIAFKSSGLQNFIFLDDLKFDDKIGDVNPELFYKGNVRWADIINNLDIKRKQCNKIYNTLKNLFDFSCKKRSLSSMLICGEGGSGKSTISMRLAFDIWNDKYFEKLNLLWLPDDKEFSFRELKLLYYTTQNPIIVFIDGLNIDYIIDSIMYQYHLIENVNLPLILIFSARLNEWINANGNEIKSLSIKYEQIKLNTLTDQEMKKLIIQLEKYNQLYELSNLTPEKRFEKFKASKGQLLVAMLEATRGKRFYEIIIDEYQKLKKGFYEAGKAYEVICLFYIYDVLIPEDLLFKLVQCIDYEDFETRVLMHTHLVIVKHPNIRYGVFYRARHKEVAKALIESLEEYQLGKKQLRTITLVLGLIDQEITSQRYVIIKFLINYMNFIIKTQPKVTYIDRFEEIKYFIKKSHKLIKRFYERASFYNHIPELVLWSKIFNDLNMLYDRNVVLELILKNRPYDRKANYFMAKNLMRTKDASETPQKIATHFYNSFIGGNRNVKFIFEFLEFCIKKNLYEFIDLIIDNFNLAHFIPYSSEEEEIRVKLKALLTWYKHNKDREELVHKFSDIASIMSDFRELEPLGILKYLDYDNSYDEKSRLDIYEKYLITIKPNRPMTLLLIIAHTSKKILGEEKKAINYYKEVYQKHIKPNPQPEHFEVIFEYVTFAVENNLQKKDINYELFNLCKKLKPFKLNTYLEFSQYALNNNDKKFAKKIAAEGLSIATHIDKYESFLAKKLKKFIVDQIQ